MTFIGKIISDMADQKRQFCNVKAALLEGAIAKDAKLKIRNAFASLSI